MVRVFYIVDVSTLKFKKIYSSPAYNFWMSFAANVLTAGKGKMSFLTEGLPDGKVRMSFTASVLIVDKRKMSFGAKGLSHCK